MMYKRQYKNSNYKSSTDVYSSSQVYIIQQKEFLFVRQK